MTQKKTAHVSELKPDKKNTNLGTERGSGVLQNSLQELGGGRSILLDKNLNIIAGNKTVEAAMQVGIENVELVHSSGDKIIAVVRDDLDLEAGGKARKLAIMDNRVGELDLAWDAFQLADLMENEPEMLDGLFSDSEVLRLLADQIEPMEGEDGVASHPEIDPTLYDATTPTRRVIIVFTGEAQRKEFFSHFGVEETPGAERITYAYDLLLNGGEGNNPV
jgi:hypothetical protein